MVALVTTLAIFALQRTIRERDAARFRNAIETIYDSLTARMDAHVSTLEATRSLFRSRCADVDLATFERFVMGLDVARRHPGIQGIGFSRRLQPGDRDAVLDELERQGQQPFELWPERSSTERQVIVFIEPMDRRNRRALGFDMSSEPIRATAMARARDTGEPTATPPITLLQEIDSDKQAGFIVFVPIYQGGVVPEDVAGRREALVGFVFSPFRIDDLMSGIFGSQREPRVAFDLYDGSTIDEAHLIHRGITRDGSPPHHADVVHLDVAGRPWTLRVVSTPAFDGATRETVLPVVVGVTLAVNVALLFATRAQVRAQNDEALARDRLATLAETSKRFSEAQLDLAVVLKTVCREVSQRLAGSCVLNLLDASGEHLELAETAHLDPEKEALFREVLSRTPAPVGETSIGKVAATGKALLLPRVDFERLLASTLPDHRRDLGQFPVTSLLVVPLRIGERIIGTLTSARGPGAVAFTWQDCQMVQEIADRAAFALENARLAERLRVSMRQAQEAVRLRNEFLSIAGHELKTPLAALQLQIEGLLRQTDKGAFGPIPKRLVERLNKANAHVERLEVLITGLLDVSRIAAGKLALHVDEVDLAALLTDVVDQFSEPVSRAGCEVSVHARGRVVGEWDRARLDQVFTNLVGNAIKYGAGKPITITVWREDDRAKVAVQDQGIGVAPEDRERIFQRFERAVSEKNYGGLGVGLWISREIVQSSGGSITLESAVGAGSTFTVELPLRPQRGEAGT